MGDDFPPHHPYPAPRLRWIRPVRLLPGLLDIERIRLCDPALADRMIEEARKCSAEAKAITSRVGRNKDTTTDE